MRWAWNTASSAGATACMPIRRRWARHFLTAFDHVLRGNYYFTDIDYALVIKALYDCGPDLPRSGTGEPMVRFASDVAPFDPARRALYKAVKIIDGKAEYYFEPVFLADPADPDGPGQPATLDVDEFIADMWLKGIRFGIDVGAVRAAIAGGKAERVTVARRLDAAPGRDAQIVEVSRRHPPQRRAAPAGQRQARPDGVPEPLPADPEGRQAAQEGAARGRRRSASSCPASRSSRRCRPTSTWRRWPVPAP